MSALSSIFLWSSLIAVSIGFEISSPTSVAALQRSSHCVTKISTTTMTTATTRSPSPLILFQSRDWIDEVSEDDMMDVMKDGLLIKPDMRYIPRNVLRQSQTFVAIREAAGTDLTNDVYMREPNAETFWFVGKLARISDVSPAQAVQRQWNLIETHAANLRPIDLFPSRGRLEIWLAPGDSEMEVAYNKPDLVFTQVPRLDPQNNAKDEETLAIVNKFKSNTMGFQGEMYEGGEEGFRTWRNNDGTPAKPEISTPDNDATAAAGGGDATRAPTDEELEKLQSMLQGQDINELYKEQQRRAGQPVNDEDD